MNDDQQTRAKEVHALPWQEVVQHLETNVDEGLSSGDVERKRDQYGSNRIRTAGKRGLLNIWLAQFRSMVVVILVGAGGLAFAFGKMTEGIAIFAVVLINCLIGFFSEWRASRSMEALRRMGQRRVRVRRDGGERDIPSASLVPGDLCLHEGGDKVSADLRLIEANSLQVDESTLTGESVPVAKTIEPVDAHRPLAERSNMLFRGTTITEGSAVGVVTATGMQTQLGRIAGMAEEARSEVTDTPLERRLNRLGHRLAWVALGAAAVIGGIGYLSGKPTVLMIETAIALGVAAIPEGLPFVATIGLARGMWLMARKQALINRLPAVETLGATNIILTDKTGTLTENRMVAHTLITPAGEHELGAPRAAGGGGSDKAHGRGAEDALLNRALEIGVLCNNASVSNEDADGQGESRQGDPTEVALLAAGLDHGINRAELLDRMPEVREVAFDAEIMMMATLHKTDKGFQFAVKGAPAAVIDHCRSLAREDTEREETLDEQTREAWQQRARDLAARGLRVLALADKQVDSEKAEPYEHLRLVGIVGLRDPPREDVREALDACRQAGIRTVMLTGDQPETARAIAASLNLVDADDTPVITGSELPDLEDPDAQETQRILKTNVFARVSPEQKLRLLTLFQADGNTVAMTGDGVNDAPALEKADIGVAMGRRGTDAAKERSDMVLKNDAFGSILSAVEQGRVIFLNIRKSTLFMLCTNVAEVAAVALASLLDWPLPIHPLQILFLNVLTDVFPALALSAGRGEPENMMRQSPRPPEESVLGRPQWIAIAAWSSIMAVCVLASLMVGIHVLGVPVKQAVTISFLTLAFAKLWFVFNLRSPDSSLRRNDIVANRWIWISLGVCGVLLGLAVYLPGLSAVLQTAAPSLTGWLLVLGFSLVPLVLGQGWLQFHRSSE